MLIDNTPVVMLLPVSLLRFNEEINDYYFPPLVGTYLRIIRFFVMLLNVVITPLWYLLATGPDGLREPGTSCWWRGSTPCRWFYSCCWWS